MQEQWKPVAGHESLYEVSNTGKVRSLNYKGEGKAQELTQGKKNYPVVCLTRGGRNKTFAVHRLVAETFIGPCPEGYQVNHKDFDKTNNHVDNLEYVTPQQNIQHQVKFLRDAGRLAPTKPAPNLASPTEKMKTRLDYWHAGQRYPLKLTGYGHSLLAAQSASPSAAISAALVAFLGGDDPAASALAFCDRHGMSLSMLVELALSRHYDR